MSDRHNKTLIKQINMLQGMIDRQGRSSERTSTYRPVRNMNSACRLSGVCPTVHHGAPAVPWNNTRRLDRRKMTTIGITKPSHVSDSSAIVSTSSDRVIRDDSSSKSQTADSQPDKLTSLCRSTLTANSASVRKTCEPRRAIMSSTVTATPTVFSRHKLVRANKSITVRRKRSASQDSRSLIGEGHSLNSSVQRHSAAVGFIGRRKLVRVSGVTSHGSTTTASTLSALHDGRVVSWQRRCSAARQTDRVARLHRRKRSCSLSQHHAISLSGRVSRFKLSRSAVSSRTSTAAAVNTPAAVTASSQVKISRASTGDRRPPCLFYCRTGRCARHQHSLAAPRIMCAGATRGRCWRLHDPRLRPVCMRYLMTGQCRGATDLTAGNDEAVGNVHSVCHLNHQPRKQKVPVCVHFLERECHNAQCRFMHVLLDDDAPLCRRFLAGFCPLADQCRHRHQYLCTEFSIRGRCRYGSSCVMAHHRLKRRTTNTTSPTTRTRPQKALKESAGVHVNKAVTSCRRYYNASNQAVSPCSQQCADHVDKEISFIRLADDSSSDDGEPCGSTNSSAMTSFVTIQVSSDEENCVS